MKVEILSVNASYSHTSLAAYIMKSILEARGIDVELDEFVTGDPPAKPVFLIAGKKPTHILMPLYIWNAEYMEKAAGDLKKLLPDTLIIAGGPQTSAYRTPDQYRGIFDVIARGECEKGLVELLEQYSGRDDTEKNAPPIEHILNPGDFRNYPFPYTARDLKGFSQKIVYYESIRGCPYTCGYCLSGSRGGSREILRFKPASTVISDIGKFLECPPKMVKFVDRTFNIDKEHSQIIWKYLAGLPSDAPPLPFQFELHPGRITEEDIDILKEIPPGRVQLEIGIQSIHNEVLRASGRRGQDDWESISNILTRLNALPNIRTHLDQIAGLPFSTAARARESIDSIIKTSPDYFQLGFLKIIPGTDFAGKEEEYGFTASAAPPYMVYRTKWIDTAEMEKLHRIEWSIDTLYNSRNFPNTMAYLTQRGSADFFEGFYRFYALPVREGGGEPSKRWESVARGLLSFCSERNDTEVIGDYLRLDWCLRSRSSLYPGDIEVTGKEEMEELRKAVWESFKKDDFKGLPSPFSMRVFNSSIIYLPRTAEGRKAAGGSLVLFLPLPQEKEKGSSQRDKEKVIIET